MTPYLRILIAVMAGLISSTAAQSQSMQLADAVDAAVVKWMNDAGIHNAEVAVSVRGTVIKSYAHGWGATDLHPIGSLSKAITGLCVARLLDSGQLHLSDTVGGVLSRFFASKDAAPADPRFKTITIEQLLTHRAGLVRNAFEATDRTIGDSLRSAAKVELQAAPGMAISYSNTGYLILGYIAQTVGKKNYEALCGGDVAALTGGASGTVEPSLNYRAPNGGWKESAVDYAKFLAFLDPQTHGLGQTARLWFDALTGDPGYASSDNGTDQPPCNLFGHSPAYGFGTCILRTARGSQYYHDGAVVGTPGGSMFFVNERGYAAVVIFDAEKAYGQLFKALRGALTTPASYLDFPSADGVAAPAALPAANAGKP